MKDSKEHPSLPTIALVPWEKNPRKNDKAVDKVADSIKRLGFGAPIVAQKGTNRVIAGHTRLKAAIKLGLEEVPVRLLDISDADADAMTLADNKLGEIAHWDDEAIAGILGGMEDELVSISGFDGFLEKETQEPPEDEAPPLPIEPVTKAGDLWELGEHFLLCGDSRSRSDLERVLNSQQVDLVFTDPPYGVDYVGKTKDALPVHNDGREGLEGLLRDALGNALQVTKAGGVWYVCAPAGPNFLPFASILAEWDVWRQTICWVKDVLVMGRSDYHYRHEAIFYGWKPGAAHQGPPNRKQDTVWEFKKPKANKIHPTMKPVALATYALEMSSDPGDVILDPFMGSGTTIMAAEHTGRKARGIEFSPAYCDAIIQRWEEYTGRKAQLLK